MFLNVRWIYQGVLLGMSTNDVLEELRINIQAKNLINTQDVILLEEELSCKQIIKNAEYVAKQPVSLSELINGVEVFG